MKSRLEIQVNEQRHKSASEDWYWESAAVSLCQGHGCHAVNNTWRLSLHVCFHFSLLKCQRWKERKRERRRKKNHQYIVVADALCDLCRSSQKRWRHFNFVIVLFSFGFAWADGSVQKCFYIPRFYKNACPFFFVCFIFIHSFIFYARFSCTQGVLESSPSCLRVRRRDHAMDKLPVLFLDFPPRMYLNGNGIVLHFLLILVTQWQPF